ncbi:MULTISPECIES: hypothetical protein [unclassified Pseudomonas]|uniref:hypothetical protein n=1 Tax=unclassified Pseudomonas TaxID=196821 RepID=UPI00244CBA11|nr:MULTISPECIES: hypothetical protein [unclassified Pseudomonas]MDH0300576.1 hypothetical protein [Pseudomonas sp. GD04091]MDH1984273.1 hypothetical protein [Pseudomonas sp. GD03689]
MLGITQRSPDPGGVDSEGAPAQETEAVREKDEQPESLQAQQRQVGLLEQQNGLLARALNAWKAPSEPGLVPEVGQAVRDAGASILIAGGGYLAAKGAAQVPAMIGRTRSGTGGSTDSEGHPDGARISASASPGTVYLPALVIGNDDRALGRDDYPLGADATPAPVPRPAEPGRWAQALQAGKSAGGMAGLDALMKLAFTATTASTPEQKGEGVGGAAGGFIGTVTGAMLGRSLKVGAPAASMMLGFAGDKVGGALGKGLMATSGNAPQPDAGSGQSAPTMASSPSPATTLWGTLAGAAGIGAGAAAFRHRDRLRRLGRGKGSLALDEPFPLGADAGPAPTGINPSAGRLARLKEAFKAPGKLPWVEAGVKAAYTYATAKTPEEKGAGYGGAIGGAVGTALGGLFLSGIVGPPVAMLIGNAVGDKVGGVVGGWVGKTLFSDKPGASIAQRDTHQDGRMPARGLIDESEGSRSIRPLSSTSSDASPGPGKPINTSAGGIATGPLALAPGTPPVASAGKYFVERAAEFEPLSRANGLLGPSVSLRDPREVTLVPKREVLDEQVGERIARQRLSTVSSFVPAPRAAVEVPAIGGTAPRTVFGAGTPAATPVSKYFSERAAEFGAITLANVPPAPVTLPEAMQPPANRGMPAQPTTQQFTFTANMPITVQGSVDAPNQLAQQLEESVRRVMQDLQRQAYNAQLADHPNAF